MLAHEASGAGQKKEIVDVLRLENAATAVKLQDAAPMLADAYAACTLHRAPSCFDHSFQEARRGVQDDQEDPWADSLAAAAAPYVGIAPQQAAAAGGSHDESDQAEAECFCLLRKDGKAYGAQYLFLFTKKVSICYLSFQFWKK